MMYSLVETGKINRVDPELYVKPPRSKRSAAARSRFPISLAERFKPVRPLPEHISRCVPTTSRRDYSRIA